MQVMEDPASGGEDASSDPMRALMKQPDPTQRILPSTSSGAGRFLYQADVLGRANMDPSVDRLEKVNQTRTGLICSEKVLRVALNCGTGFLAR